MNKILLTLSLAVLAAAAARAQTDFDATIAETVQPFVLQDSFAGIRDCGVLDIKSFRAWTLEEASGLAKPCLQAVARKYSTEMSISAGQLSPASEGRPVAPGLIIKTDLIPGSRAHRELLSSLSRRRGVLFGHQTRLLARGEVAPSAVSALQEVLGQCMTTTVVRDLQSGADFVKIYGSCLTRNKALKIDEIRPASGLIVNLKTGVDAKSVEALNGFVTVNAGKGPVTVMIVAFSAQTSKP
ncbi:MAG: hypothetical protein ACHQ49_18180 [Elusimicrobiota bacterium]